MVRRDKRGVLGLDTVKVFVIGILVIAIMVITMFLAITTLETAAEVADKGTILYVGNQSTTSVLNESGTLLNNPTLFSYRKPICSVITVTFPVNGTIVPSTNYTTNSSIYGTGCYLYLVSGASIAYNNSLFNVTYTNNYDNPGPYYIVNNITAGSTSFFNQTPTFFVLLGVVVLILIIGIVIVAVSRFGIGGGSAFGRKGGSSEGL